MPAQMAGGHYYVCIASAIACVGARALGRTHHSNTSYICGWVGGWVGGWVIKAVSNLSKFLQGVTPSLLRCYYTESLGHSSMPYLRS